MTEMTISYEAWQRRQPGAENMFSKEELECLSELRELCNCVYNLGQNWRQRWNAAMEPRQAHYLAHFWLDVKENEEPELTAGFRTAAEKLGFNLVLGLKAVWKAS